MRVGCVGVYRVSFEVFRIEGEIIFIVSFVCKILRYYIKIGVGDVGIV